MGSIQQSYIIVGAGVFGTSTALHLKAAEPNARIQLVDRTPFPCPLAASHDLNKIVRADYGDKFYLELALEAQQKWRDEDIYQPYYHESGLLNVEDTGLGRKIIHNYKDLGVESDAKMLTPAETREQFQTLFQDAKWDDVKEVFWNPRSGWAAADAALKRAIETAVDKGVSYLMANVAKLLIKENGQCYGIQSKAGNKFQADKVLLCTGAHTARILADSGPQDQDLQSGDRIVAAGVVTADVKLTSEQVAKFQHVPVFVNGMNHTMGETMPPTSDGHLKFCRDVSFTHNTYHKASGQTLSVPPESPSKNTWSQDVPQGLKQEVHDIMIKIYGKAAQDFEFQSYRMCWDGITPNQDWIISPHPHCQNLYIATAGSFHGWKFLPTVGSYVVSMLQGNLDPAKARRWAWDRDNSGAAHSKLIPRRDLSEIPGYAETAG